MISWWNTKNRLSIYLGICTYSRIVRYLLDQGAIITRDGVNPIRFERKSLKVEDLSSDRINFIWTAWSTKQYIIKQTVFPSSAIFFCGLFSHRGHHDEEKAKPGRLHALV